MKCQIVTANCNFSKFLLFQIKKTTRLKNARHLSEMREERVLCRGGKGSGQRLPQALLQLLRLPQVAGPGLHHWARQQNVLQLLLQVRLAKVRMDPTTGSFSFLGRTLGPRVTVSEVGPGLCQWMTGKVTSPIPMLWITKPKPISRQRNPLCQAILPPTSKVFTFYLLFTF